LPRAFGLVWKAGPFLTTIMIFTTLISSLIPAVALWLTKMIFDRIALVITQGTASIPNLAPIWWLIGFLAGIWIFNRVIDALNNACYTLLEFRVGNYTQSLIIQKCSTLDVVFFENPKNMDMIENASRGAQMSAWTLLWFSFSLIRVVVTLGTFFGILARLHWAATIIVAVATLPELFLAPYRARLRWKMMTDRANDNRMFFYISRLITERDPAKEIRVFNLSDYLIKRFKFYWSKFYKQETEFVRIERLSSILVGILGTIVTVGIWIYVVLRAVAGVITVGDIVLYTQAVENCKNSLIQLFGTGSNLYQQTLFLGNLFALLDLPPTKVEGALRGPEKSSARWGTIKPILPLRQGIEFQNVSFRYPNSEKLVLQNISFHLPINKSVAIVGPNGAGKTTLVKLLVRLYDPIEGNIFLDGINLRDYDLNDLRKIFGVIFQDFAHYHLTLRENIGFGEIDFVENMQKIKEASRSAGADEIAKRLPKQYETYLGKQFMMGLGEDLSGGEWQKVGIARAYMRESPIFILDEPTSSLDAFAEAEVYRGFAKMATNRTIILISHRFSTVRMADRILVLNNGQLAEEGHHEQLLAAHGLYASMFNMQAERYK